MEQVDIAKILMTLGYKNNLIGKDLTSTKLFRLITSDENVDDEMRRSRWNLQGLSLRGHWVDDDTFFVADILAGGAGPNLKLPGTIGGVFSGISGQPGLYHDVTESRQGSNDGKVFEKVFGGFREVQVDIPVVVDVLDPREAILSAIAKAEALLVSLRALL